MSNTMNHSQPDFMLAPTPDFDSGSVYTSSGFSPTIDFDYGIANKKTKECSVHTIDFEMMRRGVLPGQVILDVQDSPFYVGSAVHKEKVSFLPSASSNRAKNSRQRFFFTASTAPGKKLTSLIRGSFSAAVLSTICAFAPNNALAVCAHINTNDCYSCTQQTPPGCPCPATEPVFLRHQHAYDGNVAGFNRSYCCPASSTAMCSSDPELFDPTADGCVVYGSVTCAPAPTPAPGPTPAPTPAPTVNNLSIDPGVQGAMPRFNPALTDHKYMPPKNTQATSLVDMFPWLYMNVDTKAQHVLYRGIGNNTNAATASPLPVYSDSGTGDTPNFEYEATNTGDLTKYDPIRSANVNGNIDFEALNRTKCVKLRFNAGECSSSLPIVDDLLANTVGSWLGNPDFISSSPALLAKLQYDSCTNQMIIPMGLNPKFVFNDNLRQHDVAYNESWCQPFKAIPIDCYRNRLSGNGCLKDPGERDGKLYDYRAWGYLRLAWKSVLQDPYTPSGGTGLYFAGQLGLGDPPYMTDTMLWNNAGIPALTGITFPGVLDLVNPQGNHVSIPGAELYGDPFNTLLPGGNVGPIGAVVADMYDYTGKLTTINDLAEVPYERIWDPTHPYSPRWDFKLTDRSMSIFSRIWDPPAMGIGFSTSTSTCIVRCAAVPVDILSFRLLAFSVCMGCRVGINSSIWWTEASFLNSDVTFNYFGIAATCKAVSLDKAVNDTTKDEILGTLSGLVGDIQIPGLIWGRFNSGVGDYVGDMSVWGIPLPDCPTAICGGCHFYLCSGCFMKSIMHNTWNTDRSDAIINTSWISKPQRNKFDSLWPACSTKYDYQDPTGNLGYCAACTVASGDLNVLNGVRNCCDDVAHAVAPMNMLKIRNFVFNPGLHPAPEGYAFQGYYVFRDDRRVSPDSVDETGPEGHMPYMRWWDTGTAAGGGAGWVGINDYNPDLDCGTYDTIVGVGTEDWNGDTTLANSAPADSNPYAGGNPYNMAKYCRYGGNGFAIDAFTGLPLSLEAAQNMATAIGISDLSSFIGIDLTNIGVPPFYRCIRLRTIDVAHRELGPDAMTSWDELKIYQTRAIQNGLNCLPQYEKMHKPFSQEEAVLNAAGGAYTVPVMLNRNSVNNSKAYTKGPDEGYFMVPFKGASRMAGGTLGTDPLRPGNFDSFSEGNGIQMKTMAWPLSWRGYNSDPDCDHAFPQFAGDGSTLNLSFLATIPCGTTITGTSSGWTIPGDLTPLGNVPGPGWVTSFIWPVPAHPGGPEAWPVLPGGLFQAQVGDIVYLTYEDTNYSYAVGYVNWMLGDIGTVAGVMPYMGIVKAVNNKWVDSDGISYEPVQTEADCVGRGEACMTRCEASVVIEDVNNGKFPDVCGNTDMRGIGQSRTIYYEWLPTYVMDALFPPNIWISDNCGHVYQTKNAGVAASNEASLNYWGISNSNYGSCADPKMATCTFADLSLGFANNAAVNLWNHFRIYRPTWDFRE